MPNDQIFCPYCGTASTANVNFCAKCGKPLPKFFPSSAVESATSTPAGQIPPNPNPPTITATRSDFITLACPNCGGSLRITDDVERFACQFCGYEHIVRRSGGIVSLEPVMHAMKQINENINLVGSGIHRISGSAEKQASEAAIIRIKQEIMDVQKVIDNASSFFSWGWILVVFTGFAAFGFFYASIDVCYRLCQYVGWFLLILTLLFLFIVIFGGISQNKFIEKQKALIRQKEQEISRHYQIVSQTN